MLKTVGAAIGAILVLTFLVSVASRLTSHSDPVAQQSALQR